MKRILVIGPTPPPYHGVATAMQLLLMSEVSRNYELIHLDTADRRDLSNLGRFDLRNVAMALQHGARFVRMLVRYRPDGVYLVLSQNRLAFLRDCLFILPAIARGIPVVAHLHGGRMGHFIESTDVLTRESVKWVLARLERVVVLGESLLPMISAYVPRDRTDVIPNGIPDPGTDRPPRSERVRVLYLGSLMESKGYADVVAAARALTDAQDIEFMVAGELVDPDDAQRLVALSAELGSRFRYLGVAVGEEKRSLLRSADIFVFPTYYEYEGHPYVLLEAMAAGLAIITTDHAAIAETVRPGQEAVFVEKRAPAQLAEAIRALAADASRRHALGANARQRYQERYSYRHWTAAMQRLFDRGFARSRPEGALASNVAT